MPSPSTTAAVFLPQAGLFLAAAGHLAWVGLVAGAATAAVAVDALGGARHRRAATEICRLGRPGLLATAWLEITAIATLVLAGAVHPRFVQTGGYWAAVLLPLAAGLGAAGYFRVLLVEDRWTSFRPAVGLAGVALLVTSCLFLVGGSGTLLQPESWFMEEPPWRFLPTWSGTGRFAEFTLLSLAAAGVGAAAVGRGDLPPEVARFLRRLGSRLALACLAAWPLPMLLGLSLTPDIALSAGVWAASALGVLAAGGAAWLLSGSLGGDRPIAARALGLALAALLLLLVLGEQLARENALRPVVVAGLAPPPARVLAPAVPAPAAPALTGKVAAGKAVFDRVCSLCHRFDARKVGPPLDVVVPKYRKDPEALRAFVRAPVKKDPAYPPMPKPAVTDAEVDAVAAFLLETAAP